MIELQSKGLAHLLRAYYHLPATDLEKLCLRAGILTPSLQYYISDVTRRCKPCDGSDLPHRARKISLSRVLSSFNDHIKIYFAFIPELTEIPILHIVDTATSYSECLIIPSREILDIVSALDRRWFSVNGAPSGLSTQWGCGTLSLKSL